MKQAGFTVIETLITLIVSVLFILAINTLFITVIRSTAAARDRTEAANTAYNYLRKYTYNGADTSWFTCTTDNDIQQNANAQGTAVPVESGSLNTSQTDLPQPVTYVVTAVAPYGCTGTNTGTPLLIRATLTYGTDHQSVQQATYVERSGS